MKKKLLFLSLTLSSFIAFAQVSAGQIDDFEDGTVQNWIIGITGPLSPINVATGGPGGVDDNFLEYTSTGTNGAGARMAIFNSFQQWSGDFAAQSIVEVQMDVEVLTNDLHLRLAFQGPNGTRMISTNPVIVTAGSGWNSIALPCGINDFTVQSGPNTVSEVLAAVSTMRIISVREENIDSWRGEVIAATLRVDNITASTTLSRKDFDSKNNAFTIYPNPSRSKLNITLPTIEHASKVEVYNILGARVYSTVLNKLNTSINVSQWNNGVYLVRVSSDSGTFTKRFVKQ
ncbi:T9SS type A sorting domain-containing protein [Hanstruepera flava]|uniref:T9SS type A sorting domain-containing protein n=1 Tax=Hanstruepera flava TaxID=2930218 RepID=UPI0020297A11|nr:T9SS type A sorting domain-containing protein [Hanstruepera flava]